MSGFLLARGAFDERPAQSRTRQSFREVLAGPATSYGTVSTAMTESVTEAAEFVYTFGDDVSTD